MKIQLKKNNSSITHSISENEKRAPSGSFAAVGSFPSWDKLALVEYNSQRYHLNVPRKL
jgi:hypothetical protein